MTDSLERTDVRTATLDALWTDGGILDAISAEREAQDSKWGAQSHPDGTGAPGDRIHANAVRALCQERFAAGFGSWYHVLKEEVAEAFAESDTAKLREELIQVAAVCAAWIQDIDSR